MKALTGHVMRHLANFCLRLKQTCEQERKNVVQLMGDCLKIYPHNFDVFLCYYKLNPKPCICSHFYLLDITLMFVYGRIETILG